MSQASLLTARLQLVPLADEHLEHEVALDGDPAVMRFLDAVDAPSEAELGYRLGSRWWRRGFASEGAAELLRHAFEDLGLTRVFAQTMAVNAGSRAVMAKVGLRLVRTFLEEFAVTIPGAEHGEVEYAITADEWRRASARPSPPRR